MIKSTPCSYALVHSHLTLFHCPATRAPHSQNVWMTQKRTKRIHAKVRLPWYVISNSFGRLQIYRILENSRKCMMSHSNNYWCMPCYRSTLISRALTTHWQNDFNGRQLSFVTHIMWKSFLWNALHFDPIHCSVMQSHIGHELDRNDGSPDDSITVDFMLLGEEHHRFGLAITGRRGCT